MANDIKELNRFCNDPKYREKIIARVHKDMDKEYNRRINAIETQKNALIVSRNNEISRISKSRWESYANNKLMVNRTEGTISVNNNMYLFSNIIGAEINMVPGCRVVSTETAKTKGRKHASVGGAIVGGMVAGPVGAVVGGSALGKTKSKTRSKVVTNQIPTCMHLGVIVNLDGFSSEIQLITRQIDQSNSAFTKAYQEAQNIIALLGTLAKTPVPQSFLRPEEEQSVRLLDEQIINKQQELETAKADVPTYALPEMYRTAEQRSMSDEEYLQYLRENDSQRMLQPQAVTYQPGTLTNFYNTTTPAYDAAEPSRGRRVGKIIFNICFWTFSVILALLSLIMLVGSGGIVSSIIFLLTALLVNPLIGDLICNKVIEFPRWIAAIILVIGFFAGILLSSPSKTTADSSLPETNTSETTGLS